MKSKFLKITGLVLVVALVFSMPAFAAANPAGAKTSEEILRLRETMLDRVIPLESGGWYIREGWFDKAELAAGHFPKDTLIAPGVTCWVETDDGWVNAEEAGWVKAEAYPGGTEPDFEELARTLKEVLRRVEAGEVEKEIWLSRADFSIFDKNTPIAPAVICWVKTDGGWISAEEAGLITGEKTAQILAEEKAMRVSGEVCSACGIGEIRETTPHDTERAICPSHGVSCVKHKMYSYVYYYCSNTSCGDTWKGSRILDSVVHY